MITDNGKELISKFLLGQAPSYASHIAIGCGAVPLDANDTAPSASVLAAKETLDFEMYRAPVTSKGFVDDNGITKVALTAELPTENRYDITEVGLWSAGSNNLARSFDSRNVFTFTENWQGHNTSIFELPQPTTIGSSGNITTTYKVFKASNSDPVFQDSTRKSRKEGPRFLNSSILLRGDSSIIFGNENSTTADIVSYTISNKVLTSNVATLTTSTNHSMIAGEIVYVDINDAKFDGRRTITAVTSNTFSFASDNTNVGSTATSGWAVPGGNWSGGDAVYTVTNKSLTSSVATLTVSNTHFVNVGDNITVNIGDASFDGTYTVTATTGSTLNYISNTANVTSASAAGALSYLDSTHIHLNNINLNIGQNSPADTFKFAVSLIDADALASNGLPQYVKILMEFYRNEVATTTGFAKAEIYLSGNDFSGDYYKVVSIPISELFTSADFSSSDIRISRIFASVIYNDSGQLKTSPNHYVLLDGFRLDNTNTANPLYKLTGYSVVRTTDGSPITKYQNTSNYVEFRFNLGVG